MFDKILQLTILFFVIIDPLASFAVFFAATKNMTKGYRVRTALGAILVAMLLSYTFLFLGEGVITVFGTSMADFKIAASIVLAILGIKMILGGSFTKEETEIANGKASYQAIAALIGTPLLTGPATITTIIISVKDYGVFPTGIAITVILGLTSVLFLSANHIHRFIPAAIVRVISTILGLITLAWAAKFFRTAARAIGVF
jgi:multiple antibiotic resistance protein